MLAQSTVSDPFYEPRSRRDDSDPQLLGDLSLRGVVQSGAPLTVGSDGQDRGLPSPELSDEVEPLCVLVASGVPTACPRCAEIVAAGRRRNEPGCGSRIHRDEYLRLKIDGRVVVEECRLPDYHDGPIRPGTARRGSLAKGYPPAPGHGVA